MLTHKKAKWHLGEVQQKAFDELKYKFTHALLLACPDFTKPFILQTDTSDDRLGAMLTQIVYERERVIAYTSRSLSPAKLTYINYSAIEKDASGR